MSIDRIREIIQSIEDQSCSEEQLNWLAECFEEYINKAPLGTGYTLDKAFGVHAYTGQQNWWLKTAKDERNELFIELAKKHYKQRIVTKKAFSILSDLRRYEQTAWRGDKSLKQLPENLIGKKGEYFWKILKLKTFIPSTPRQIERILRH